MTPDPHLARWEATRRRGPWRFILLRGVLLWGLGCGLLFGLLSASAFPQAPAAQRWALSLSLFPLGGLVLGALLWRTHERTYRALKKDAPHA